MQQRPGATSAHIFCLGADHARDDIESNDHCFWIVADGALSITRPVSVLGGSGAAVAPLGVKQPPAAAYCFATAFVIWR